MIDGKKAVYRSAHPYLDRNNPTAGPKYIERTHPLVRVHPATGWKALWVNRSMTVRIEGLDKAESDLILNYLYDVYERNVDIQVRFKWTPRTSALWDNRSVMRSKCFSLTDNRSGLRSTMPAGITKATNQDMALESPHWPRRPTLTHLLRPVGRLLESWDLESCRVLLCRLETDVGRLKTHFSENLVCAVWEKHL